MLTGLLIAQHVRSRISGIRNVYLHHNEDLLQPSE
jgi:hypothetical protein